MSNTPPLFCIDCRHYLDGDCLNSPALNVEYLVHGDEDTKTYFPCNIERKYATQSGCGPSGKHWQSHE